MAKKKADQVPPKAKKGKLSSYRLSTEGDEMVEEISACFSLTKSASVEAGIRILHGLLFRGTVKQAKAALEAAKNSE